MPRAATKIEGRSVRLKPADPFELVRLLARSQSDPRKAVAELVQNSLDAGATEIVIERVRQRGVLTLVVRDDGRGVLPERDREAALHHIATNIGHSHKLGIDPSERAKRVVAGQYGVGLLGFWSVGGTMELRSRVSGSELCVLRMVEDSPDARIGRLALRTDAPPTYTEVVIAPVHDMAQKALGGRRLSDYLASELRGQILAHSARVVVRDRAARGTAQKEFLVQPKRFSGERLSLPESIAIEGYEHLRIDLYLARGTATPAIQIACLGTVVADDIGELSALGLSGAPWVGSDLVGLLDFPSFSVPPGTRRGVAPDRAALAFVTALENTLGPLVAAELERLDAQRRAAADREIVAELRRALRGLGRRLPQYELPSVADGDRGRGQDVGEGLPAGDSGAPPELPTEPLELFPPGQLDAVRIVPDAVKVAPGAERRVRAVATDAAGRRIAAATFKWRMLPESGADISVRGEGTRPALVASPVARIGAEAALEVEAGDPRHPGARATARATVTVAEDAGGADLGIPEPNLVGDPDGRWRSRLVGDRWDVNDAHPDYVSLRAEPRTRVRYLLALLAKEIVVRTTGRVDAAETLESLVEVLAHAEKNLRGS